MSREKEKDDRPGLQPRDSSNSGSIKITKMTPERRSEILAALRLLIPKMAADRKKVIKKNAKYANLCILDAFQGRLSNGLANNSKKDPWLYWIFRVQTSTALFRAVLGACVLHTLSLFFEPENSCSSSVLYTLFQLCILLVYTTDIALKMSYEGRVEYFRHNWQQLYVIVVALSYLDLMFNWCTYYTNPLRPVVGLLRARNGRRFFEVLKKMVPGMSHSLIPIFVFVILVTAISGIYFDVNFKEYADESFTSYNWFFLLFTGDNFDRLLPEQMLRNMSYLLFFVPAIYVGQQFLLSLIIGDTYDTFRSHVKAQLKKEKLKQMQGLTKAFSALDDYKNGVISNEVWKECLSAFNPDISLEEIALYYELISGGGQAGVSILQFLSFRNALSFRLSTIHAKPPDSFMGKIDKFWGNLTKSFIEYRVMIPKAFSHPCHRILKIVEKKELLHYLNSLDLIVYASGYSDHVFFSFLGFSLTPCVVITSLYVGELVLRLADNDGSVGSISTDNNFISYVFLTGNIVRILFGSFASLFQWDLESIITVPLYFINFTFPLRKVYVFCRLARGMRIANLNTDLKDFNSALLDVIPTLVETFIFTFIITYMFGTLGYLIFGAYMPDTWGTPLRAVVKAQQLSFMVDFLDSMEEAMEAVHPLSSLYFVCYLILSLAVSNIALSIIIDLHANQMNVKSNKDREGQKTKLDIVFEKIVERARTRDLFNRRSKDGRSLNFSNVRMSQFQSSDVRHFIADTSGGDSSINTDDLKKCQKYTKVDLIKHYNEVHRNHKDLTWEMDFLSSVQECGVENKEFQAGEVIFQKGGAAGRVYLLTSGKVFLERISKETGSKEQQILLPTNIFGYECLDPNGHYMMTATAEGITSCLCFSREDISLKLDTELCGSVVRLAFRSSTLIETAFQADGRRKSYMEKRKSARFGSAVRKNIALGSFKKNSGKVKEKEIAESPQTVDSQSEDNDSDVGLLTRITSRNLEHVDSMNDVKLEGKIGEFRNLDTRIFRSVETESEKGEEPLVVTEGLPKLTTIFSADSGDLQKEMEPTPVKKIDENAPDS